MPSICQNGICINTIGSFKCECNQGYAYDYHTTVCNGKKMFYIVNYPFKKVSRLFGEISLGYLRS